MKNKRQNGNFQFEEDTFSRDARGIRKIHHEVLLLTKFLETKPKVNSMKINHHILYYTVIENRDDKEIVDEKYENKEIEYISFIDFITPNHYIGRKNNHVILR